MMNTPTLQDIKDMSKAQREAEAARLNILTPSGKPSTDARRIHAAIVEEITTAEAATPAPAGDAPMMNDTTPTAPAGDAYTRDVTVRLTLKGASPELLEAIRAAVEAAGAPAALDSSPRAYISSRVLIPEGMTRRELSAWWEALPYPDQSSIKGRIEYLINDRLTRHSDPAHLMTEEERENGEGPRLTGGDWVYTVGNNEHGEDDRALALIRCGFLPERARYTVNGETFDTIEPAFKAAGFHAPETPGGEWEDMNGDTYETPRDLLRMSASCGVVEVTPEPGTSWTDEDWTDEDGTVYADEAEALAAAEEFYGLTKEPAYGEEFPPMWGTVWVISSLPGNMTAQQTAEFTGFSVYEKDGEPGYILGVNGGGYDFYEAHWLPLFYAHGWLS